METVVFLIALFTVSQGNAEPRNQNDENLHVNKRIANGDLVSDPTKHPWQAFLQFDFDFRCGAVIIDSHWAITARICVESGYTKDYSIGVGSCNRLRGDRYQIAEIIKHEYYSPMFGNNIALLRVEESMTDGKTVKPISLDSFADYKNCWITGWCSTWNLAGDLSIILQEAEVDVYKFHDCLKRDSPFTYGKVCVGDKGNKPSGPCLGDGGSPLTCRSTENEPILIGISSNTFLGCNTSHPRFYTRIFYFRDWIHAKTKVKTDVLYVL